MTKHSKIYTSKGKLHFVCPYIKKIDDILVTSLSENRVITAEEYLTIKGNHDCIVEIGSTMHKDHDGFNIDKKCTDKMGTPYDIDIVLQRIRTLIKSGIINKDNLTSFDETIELYL